MAKYIIIEDEQLAYNELKRMMMTVRPDWELCGWASSVEQAIILIKSTAADLLLVDIRLSDGDSFEIFDRIKTSVPVIFTTAYDEFALKAFKLNSIDYLLKPIEETDLEAALQKYESLRAITPESDSYAQFRNYYLSSNLKNRFLVQCGDIYQHIETRDGAFFYSEEKYNYLHTFSGRRYIIDYT
ncbi:MAG: response regulator, partial [Muribaculum sp.]|nr:response regulator [Muribaculum sp.]